MNHNSNRYDDSPDSWPIRSSCGGGCGGGASRMGVSQISQRWDESWQPDYVPRAPATPRMTMPRFYPDEQPDAVSPVFSRAGVERLVPPRYDDSPDSPNFYEPRIPQTMQSPGMPMQQRPWDDGPDSPNFYGQPVPPVMQPSGMLRSWDDSPDSPNFYAPPIPQAMQPLGIQMQQRPWDDGPDTDNFYRPGNSSLQEMPAVITRPWDDGPDTDSFYRQVSEYPPRHVTQRQVDKYFQPDSITTRYQREMPIMDNPENWISLAKAPPWAKYLGRAITAREAFQQGEGICTYWSAGGDLLIGAAHCRGNMGPKVEFRFNAEFNRDDFLNVTFCPSVNIHDQISSNKLFPFLFGLPQDTSTSENENERVALEFAVTQARMIDLGIPEHTVKFHSDYDKKALTEFSCRLIDSSYRKTDGCRDVDFLRCEKKSYRFYSMDSLVPDEKFSIFPSAIYGSIPLDPFYIPKLQRAYSVISLNIKSQENPNTIKPRHLLFSDGGEIQKIDPHGLYFQGRGAYIYKGSSGGPAIDSQTKDAIGVLSQTWFNIMEWDLDEFATIPGRTFKYIGVWPYHFISSNRNNLAYKNNSNRIGNSPGLQPFNLSCPLGYAVAGVLSSTITDRITPRYFIGNLGLVCLPFSDTYQFEHALVIAGGSLDTSEQNKYAVGISGNGMPFDAYMVKHFSSGMNRLPSNPEIRSWNMQPQNFKMCPPNYFLRGIQGIERSHKENGLGYIQSIRMLECGRYNQPKNARDFVVAPRLPMGDVRENDMSRVLCPNGTFVTGMNIWANEYTHAFEFHCSEPPQVRGMMGDNRQQFRKYCEPWEICESPPPFSMIKMR